jgi:hypothetical protein
MFCSSLDRKSMVLQLEADRRETTYFFCTDGRYGGDSNELRHDN